MICYLDRDGIVNIDYGYVGTMERLCINSKIIKVCKKLKRKGYKFIIVTNQSGLSRKYYSYNDFLEVSFYILNYFYRHEIDLEIRYCRHLPQDLCECRKPEIGMLKSDKRTINDIIIGDNDSDMIAGYKAEINNRWLIINDKQRKTVGYETNVFNNLEELSNWLDYGPREGS